MKRFKKVLFIGLATALISAIAAEENPAVKKDLALLQGEWSMVSGSANGHPMPDDFRTIMKRACKDDETTVRMGNRLFFKARITIDPSKKPKTIDYEMTDGLSKGKTQLGIYEIEGDTLKSCFAAPGGERPADFTSKPGDGRSLSIWKRDKSSAAPPEEKK